MDKLVQTRRERFWNAEAWIRDEWVQQQAKSLARDSCVLDAGAGACKYRPFFSHCNYKTQDFCQYQGPLVKYIQPIDLVCDITAMPLPPESLDAILCTEVLEHVVAPMAVLAEFSRLTKMGGKLFLTAPLLSSLHMEPYHYYGGFTKYWYEHWLPKYGFRIDSITPIGGPGRSCVNFLMLLYSHWAEAEHRSRFPLKAISKLLRAFGKIPIHYLLPRVLPRLDPWFGSSNVCSGYMVAATRCSGRKQLSSL